MRSGPVESDCGCGPTPSELRALHGGVTRRTVVVAGALGALIAGFASGPGDPAFAAKYPTWDDVERARRNEASKNAEIARIETLIRSLQSDVEAKQAEAERLGQEHVLGGAVDFAFAPEGIRCRFEIPFDRVSGDRVDGAEPDAAGTAAHRSNRPVSRKPDRRNIETTPGNAEEALRADSTG